MIDVLSGGVYTKWTRPDFGKSKTTLEFLHHHRDYFRCLKRPCCPLCNVMKQCMWSSANPCALNRSDNWQLRIFLDSYKGRVLPLEELWVAAHPGPRVGTAISDIWSRSFLLEMVDTAHPETSRMPRLPGLPEGLPVVGIKVWMHACLNKHAGHELCLKASPVALTRLLDLSSVPVRVVGLLSVEVRYVALSHCWGGPIKTKLLDSNLAKFMADGIPEDALPATLQDAIFVCRRLGVQWLWIDALCIVQDNEIDWDREAARMCNIYENAIFVLSAYSTPSSDAGLNFCRSAEIATHAGGILYAQRHSQLFDTLEPLRSRGWTLQEHVLASAVLYIGRGFIRWHCRGGQYCKGNEALQDLPDDSLLQTFAAIGERHGATPAGVWRKIVGLYSARKLTFPQDKMPAIAGIVDKYLSLYVNAEDRPAKRSYIAGLWKESFLADLMWATEPRERTIVQQDRAPSWSWLSVDGPVHWMVLERLLSISRTHMPQWWHFTVDLSQFNMRMSTRQVQGELLVSGNLTYIASGRIRSSFNVAASLGRIGEGEDLIYSMADLPALIDKPIRTALEGAEGPKVQARRDIAGYVDHDTVGSCWALKMCSEYTRPDDLTTVFMLIEQVEPTDSTVGRPSDRVRYRRVGLVDVTYSFHQEWQARLDAHGVRKQWPAQADPVGWDEHFTEFILT